MEQVCSDVRLAVPADREGLIDLTSKLHGENGLFSRDEAKVQEMLDRYYKQRQAVIGVIGEVGDPVATIYLMIDQLIYSNDWALVEQWNYVSPEHRRTNYARQLLVYAKSVSDKLKVPLLVGILSNKRTEAKVRLYQREMEPIGAYFLHNRKFITGGHWGD